MRKRIICLLMVIVVVMTAVGCGSKSNSNSENTSENNSDTGNNHLGNTGMPGSEEEGGYSQDITMQEIKDAVVEILAENYWPDTAIDATSLEEIYGISPDMYEDYLAECPMISVNVDTLIIVKAKEGQEEAVINALETYREKNISENMQYPMNLGKVQASRIEAYDNYVCFVQLGADTTAAMDVSEEAVVDQCLEENERALDAIEKALLK